ncbi:hypothetical protein EG327_004901 [Venturia inaequalis]|uniref:Uncharacterized protein n=1 Tax=Venturia inaequalis TaxID=5025 RepID=A0A8H3VBQ1_VENIN|nr:hypothetical protein EG327_004901 [Venturia inaequalis]
MSGSARNNDIENGIDIEALNDMTQAELEGDNNFATPLVPRDWDAAHGTDIHAQLVADEDIPESSLGSPLISNNQGLYSNITLSGSTIIPSEAIDSTTTENSRLAGHGHNMYGADMTTGESFQERAPTPSNMEWVTGTYPRQYRPISSLPGLEEDEDRVFTTAPSSPDATEEMPSAQNIAFIGKDVRAATGSMIPLVDGSGRPMHFVNENGVPYSSGIFMFQKCIMSIVKCIEEDRYLHAHDALYEFCTLYTNAASMTKYKRIQCVVIDAKEIVENASILSYESQLQAANSKIQEHVNELIEMTVLARDFLEYTPFVKKGVEEVEEARLACLKLLVSKMAEVEAMEKTWETWNEVELLLQEIAQAVYELGIVCTESV